MIYNQHDWDQDGMPVLDQDLKEGYEEVEEGIKLSSEEKRFIWLMIGLGLLALGGLMFACVTYEPPT
ncbi:hypothetical protein [Arcticibacter sp.]|uniref:hypothetical protein n=1 Tax=Arcticibacter sp. TaxID=1872630 RepID=UPI00388E3E66